MKVQNFGCEFSSPNTIFSSCNRIPGGAYQSDSAGSQANKNSREKEKTNDNLKSNTTKYNLKSSSPVTMEMKSKLFVEVGQQSQSSLHKVTVVGSGMVGMACAFSILTQNVSSEVALLDVNADKLKGELMDLQHGSAFLKSAKVSASTDYSVTADSRVIIISAGVRQKENENRLQLLQRNLDIFKDMIPKLVSYSPDAIFLVVSNPVDLLTHITWKLSGLPSQKVFGSGTNLDTSRFRFIISQKLNVAVESVHGWIIGEHGDSSVPVWSGVNIAGVTLKDIYPALATGNDPDNWKNVHSDVVNSAYEIIKLKGYTSWAIGLSVADLTATILRNTHKIHAVTTNIKGLYDITEDVYLSIPCILGETGVSQLVKQQLTNEEKQKLQNSANILLEHIKQLKI